MYELFKDSPAIQWIEESGRQEERKKTLATLRRTVVELVAQRFPTLKRLAKAQVRALDQAEQFSQVLLRLSLARDFDEAQEVLLSLQEDEDTKHVQEPM
jgi:hypothetical protein